jgi:GNAT superfamily N-acetyltransferase
VWSVVCFFVKKSHRHRGISIRLLQAAIAYVRQQGGQVVEGYPVEPQTDTLPSVFAWTGLSSAFKQAGFSECARRSATRPLMRYHSRIMHAVCCATTINLCGVWST